MPRPSAPQATNGSIALPECPRDEEELCGVRREDERRGQDEEARPARIGQEPGDRHVQATQRRADALPALPSP